MKDEIKVFDVHGHLPGTIPRLLKIFKRGAPQDTNLDDFRAFKMAGGSVCVLGDPNTFRPWKTDAFAYVKRGIKRVKGKIDSVSAMVIKSPEDLSGLSKGDIGFIIGVEGADFLEEDLKRLDSVYKMGVRTLCLLHYSKNSVGTMCMDLKGREIREGGLTVFGEKVVKRMNELGIIVDIAHCNEKTAFEVIESSSKPVMISHTGPRSLFNSPRFVSDELMEKVTKDDGLVGLWAGWYKGNGVPDVKAFCQSARYVAKRVGVEHVALGSDFNGVLGYMNGYKGIEDYPFLIDELMHHGFSFYDVRKICFENFLSFFQKVQSLHFTLS